MSGAIRRQTSKNVLPPTKTKKPFISPEKINSRISQSPKSPVKEASTTLKSVSLNKQNGKGVAYKNSRIANISHSIGEFRSFT